jgi:hypothetical protein
LLRRVPGNRRCPGCLLYFLAMPGPAESLAGLERGPRGRKTILRSLVQ